MAQTVAQKRWAIFLGVNCIDETSEYYNVEKNTAKKMALKGAVADATAMGEYFKKQSIDSTILVTGGSPESLPTQANFARAVNRIAKDGDPGDLVYIHFSGHGTRRMRDDSHDQSILARSRTGPQILALCLYDRPLHGSTLRKGLWRLEARQMPVTLVLDCCFSGSVLRNEVALRPANVRFMDCHLSLAADTVADDADPFFMDFPPASLRRADLDTDPLSLLDPAKHSILAACGPGQEAREIRLDGAAYHGALSYFLLDTLQMLRRRSSRISWQSLHQHLCARFHAEYPAQTPMWYGKSGFSFFQELAVVDTPRCVFVSMYRSQEGPMELGAGQAHGVHAGDQYEAYRYYATEEQDQDPDAAANGASPDDQPVRVVVKKVGCLTSTLAAASPADGERMKHGSSWKARCVHTHVLGRVPIGIAPSVLAHVDAAVLAAVAREHNYLDLATAQDGDGDGNEPVLHISRTENNAYQVQDNAGRSVQDLQDLGTNDSPSAQSISLANLAGHLATFKFFEGLQNESPDGTFDKEFAMECHTLPSADGCYEIQHGSWWGITFRNLGRAPSTCPFLISDRRGKSATSWPANMKATVYLCRPRQKTAAASFLCS